ncbi:MAG TPA: SGNH/GDSL hydrolase family protein [Streptosporangiaceae bacterium]|jgi:lysophospholipase L1-like esterase|nr:SGNH/GDSL hydrolase family protein [Streptosporangiaceae bacterium]
MRDTIPEIGAFVALGDSFTEGLGDPHPDEAGYRGWADRFAEQLAASRPGLRYANLAVRGKVVAEVAADQIPVAIAMAPDLVSIAAGGNDLLRPRADPDALAQAFDAAVADLRAAGCEVMLFTGFDPRTFPVIRLIRGKAAAYNMHLRAIADQRDCRLVDLWSMRVLDDPREWSADRLHLSSDGHRRVALRASEVMGVPVDEDWRQPLPPRLSPAAVLAKTAVQSRSAALSQTTDWLAARRLDARWARVHAMPWVSRQLRGVSSGDGIPPKRPDMLPL